MEWSTRTVRLLYLAPTIYFAAFDAFLTALSISSTVRKIWPRIFSSQPLVPSSTSMMYLRTSSIVLPILRAMGFTRMLCVAGLSRYRPIWVVTSARRSSSSVAFFFIWSSTFLPLKKDWVFSVSESTLWQLSTSVTTSFTNIFDVCSMKALHAERRASSRSRLESTDSSWTDTPSRSNVTSAFSVLMENRRRLRLARNRDTALPASLKSSWRSTDRSFTSNGDSCSRRIRRCLTRNKSECMMPLRFSM
mmetsp:Transcript_14141/g.38973  ORF Transcript_14141/g.38973 Transcript_14141/m.38973 type:complete len:248 (+) Transcript_14141:75-818(+)